MKQRATTATFDALVAGAPGLVVAYFHGPGCPACRAVEADLPALLAGAPDGVTLLEIDAYAETALVRRYGLAGVPAFVLLARGRTLGAMRGYPGREAWLEVVRGRADIDA